jgi:hypothetical protein
MIKPECFRIGCVAFCNTLYGIDETSRPEMFSSGGVLRKGQPVWLKESLTAKRMKTIVPAYVEHLGIVSLDTRFLVDSGHPVEPSRSSKPNQENHSDDYVTR